MVGACRAVRRLVIVSVFVSGCSPEVPHGVLVGRFLDGSRAMKTKIVLPAQGKPYLLQYEIRRDSDLLSCQLSATPAEKNKPDSGDCAGISGVGTLSCSDGRVHPLTWLLTSCRSGFGWSSKRGKPTFVFGFGRNSDRALDQLDVANDAE